MTPHRLYFQGCIRGNSPDVKGFLRENQVLAGLMRLRERCAAIGFAEKAQAARGRQRTETAEKISECAGAAADLFTEIRRATTCVQPAEDVTRGEVVAVPKKDADTGESGGRIENPDPKTGESARKPEETDSTEAVTEKVVAEEKSTEKVAGNRKSEEAATGEKFPDPALAATNVSSPRKITQGEKASTNSSGNNSDDFSKSSEKELPNAACGLSDEHTHTGVSSERSPSASTEEAHNKSKDTQVVPHEVQHNPSTVQDLAKSSGECSARPKKPGRGTAKKKACAGKRPKGWEREDFVLQFKSSTELANAKNGLVTKRPRRKSTLTGRVPHPLRFQDDTRIYHLILRMVMIGTLCNCCAM